MAKSQFANIVTVFAAFTAGICTGLMLAPSSGKQLRRRIGEEAQEKLKVAEEKLEFVESQISEVNQKLQEAGKELGDRVKEAAKESLDDVIPDLSADGESWDLTKDDVNKELRRMAR